MGSIIWLDYTIGGYSSGDLAGHHLVWVNSLNQNEALNITLNPGVSVTWQGDWRLPSTVDGPYITGYDGTTTAGFNITTSELGHLYYSELENKGFYDKNGQFQSGYGFTNTGPFQDLGPYFYYFSGTKHLHSVNPGTYFWAFYNGGNQDLTTNVDVHGASLAVRPGHVEWSDGAPVPEPATMMLFGSGLVGLVGFGRRKFRKS